MLEKKIMIANMKPECVSREIGDFVVGTVLRQGSRGCVIGLSGGVDSTTTAALVKTAFDAYNKGHSGQELELVGYILPSGVNAPADAEDGVKVAKRLGIRYEVLGIDKIVDAFGSTNPEAIGDKYHKGNLMSRIRANILSTKAAAENKLVAGTGNKDEDFGIGYYTLFGDGAVHLSPIGNLPKRLVREMARHLGFADLADREPTAGLEPGQTDFRDLGYSYDTVELVSCAFEQGLSGDEISRHSRVAPRVEKESAQYEHLYGCRKFNDAKAVVEDIYRRHRIALSKAQIIHPPIAPVTLEYV